MKKLQFTININAPKEKVWKVLWDDSTYRVWTKPFSEGSYAESDWKEGSRILFLNGEGSGMFSTIARMVPNEFISFRHIGVIKDGKEMPMNEETEKWSGATENYSLSESDGQTKLEVEMDGGSDFDDFFNETFPKAFSIVKELSEK